MRLESYVTDKKYKELFESIDNTELEKQIEEELQLLEEVENPPPLPD